MNLSPLAGQPAPAAMRVDVPRLVTAYYAQRPDPSVPQQRVQFGTSGHRGSAFDQDLQRIAHPRDQLRRSATTAGSKGIDGPLFLGIDTHALSVPAFASALEVLAANGVETMIAGRTNTRRRPRSRTRFSRYNRGRTSGFADGIVITPSHNPPAGRRLQVQPAARRPGRDGRHQLDRDEGERISRKRAAGREANSL